MLTINKSKLLAAERLEMTFKMFDSDGSGTISIEELRTLFGNNQSITDELFNQMIKEVDENNSNG